VLDQIAITEIIMAQLVVKCIIKPLRFADSIEFKVPSMCKLMSARCAVISLPVAIQRKTNHSMNRKSRLGKLCASRAQNHCGIPIVFNAINFLSTLLFMEPGSLQRKETNCEAQWSAEFLIPHG
jgi:hypothetical protein